MFVSASKSQQFPCQRCCCSVQPMPSNCRRGTGTLICASSDLFLSISKVCLSTTISGGGLVTVSLSKKPKNQKTDQFEFGGLLLLYVALGSLMISSLNHLSLTRLSLYNLPFHVGVTVLIRFRPWGFM